MAREPKISENTLNWLGRESVGAAYQAYTEIVDLRYWLTVAEAERDKLKNDELSHLAKIYASTYKKEPNSMQNFLNKKTEYKKIKRAKLVQDYGLVTEFEDETISVSGTCSGVVLSKDALVSDPDRLVAKALFGTQTVPVPVPVPASSTGKDLITRKAQVFDELLATYRNQSLNTPDTQDRLWNILQSADNEF
jgi:hypothetical protein